MAEAVKGPKKTLEVVGRIKEKKKRITEQETDRN